ncbi:hypothetical protein VB618_11925 [Microvirga sp. CF3062]|uniref:hypothetical protein n=1 Tax=Microvirga sp. CF3062 TaxID=3110182 RepID=UPI002E79F7ED|nr:hypothetical protein [Microvirga sp. CF3062]MEE1656907.1 hypothetical protein [Microvirga sp. CF3062]
MKNPAYAMAILGFACLPLTTEVRAQDCIVSPMSFNSHVANIEGEMTVKAGKGCGFGLNGIEGAITEAAIVQKPKAGMAGVRGIMPFYVAKPGYRGADEFSYAIIGTDQYGGPMRVTTKMKVTVVP